MILLEEKIEAAVETTPWVNAVVNIGFNMIALYVSHLVTLEIWRSLTGH